MILADLKGHMVSDTSVAELHEFAAHIGLHRCYFRVGRGHPHYDLTTASRLLVALTAGAFYTTTRRIVKRMARE